jgi:uncharacterized protein YeaO (DUF488 family)
VTIATRRVYDAPSARDGRRVLVDRLWPRGLSKEAARLDEWARDAAPSDELRRWFHADPSRWGEFRRRYLAELKAHREALRPLAERARRGRVTLLYARSAAERNHATVLAEYLRRLGPR